MAKLITTGASNALIGNYITHCRNAARPREGVTAGLRDLFVDACVSVAKRSVQFLSMSIWRRKMPETAAGQAHRPRRSRARQAQRDRHLTGLIVRAAKLWCRGRPPTASGIRSSLLEASKRFHICSARNHRLKLELNHESILDRGYLEILRGAYVFGSGRLAHRRGTGPRFRWRSFDDPRLSISMKRRRAASFSGGTDRQRLAHHCVTMRLLIGGELHPAEEFVGVGTTTMSLGRAGAPRRISLRVDARWLVCPTSNSVRRHAFRSRVRRPP